MPKHIDRFCDCGTPVRCADANGSITYDPIFNEFHLSVGAKDYQLLYCFNCGGKLPVSTRDKQFTVPSLQECKQVATLMSSCRSAADVTHELGPGDATTQGDAFAYWPPRDSPWRRQFIYTRRWITLVLVVIEYTDGSLSFGINGQPIQV